MFFEKNWNSTSLIWKRIIQLNTLKSKIRRGHNILTVKGKAVTNCIGIVMLLTILLISVPVNLKPFLVLKKNYKFACKVFTKFICSLLTNYPRRNIETYISGG